jgi:hypothetical protein
MFRVVGIYNFGCAIIPFQNILTNPLEHFTFGQKSIEFCIPERETSQPVFP